MHRNMLMTLKHLILLQHIHTSAMKQVVKVINKINAVKTLIAAVISFYMCRQLYFIT